MSGPLAARPRPWRGPSGGTTRWVVGWCAHRRRSPSRQGASGAVRQATAGAACATGPASIGKPYVFETDLGDSLLLQPTPTRAAPALTPAKPRRSSILSASHPLPFSSPCRCRHSP